MTGIIKPDTIPKNLIMKIDLIEEEASMEEEELSPGDIMKIVHIMLLSRTDL
jgi:hypothetical protein